MGYKVLIGLEMHCEISNTKTKVFSSAINGYSEKANTNIRPVDMAFPGTLPLVNKEAVRLSLMASMILNCSQPEYLYFERKNYYYPDLPKGFQITQETKPAPIGSYGKLEYEVNGEKKTVRINNLHLEEDAASSDHYASGSRINYNRAGVPLLELARPWTPPSRWWNTCPAGTATSPGPAAGRTCPPQPRTTSSIWKRLWAARSPISRWAPSGKLTSTETEGPGGFSGKIRRQTARAVLT